MNKYQEELNHIINSIGYNFKKSDYKNILKLVDKETPKEVRSATWNDKVVGKVTEYFCPTCNNSLEIHTNTNFNYNDKYCRFCGQRISYKKTSKDWSEE